MMTTWQVSRRTGATLRQLQWWDEQGVVFPIAREGHERLWDLADVNRVLFVVQLRRRGISLQRVRRMLKRHAVDLLGTETWAILDPAGRIVAFTSDCEVLLRHLEDDSRRLQAIRINRVTQAEVDGAAQGFRRRVAA